MLHRSKLLFVIVVLATQRWDAAAHGEFIRNLGVGLAAAGFDAQGSRNILSGGFDLLVNNNFASDVFRFGVGELRLAGPISLDVSTGTRFVPTLDVHFRTALNRDANAAPLNYHLTADVGAQETTIEGSLFIDGNVSLNAFGFYDVEFTYSSRQTAINEGNVSNLTEQYDFDLGPTVLSGNVFMDLLVALTNPLFAQAGIDNPLAGFSGQAQLKQVLAGALVEAHGIELAHLSASDPVIGPIRRGLSSRDLHAELNASVVAAATTGHVVPEPVTVVLMLACVSMVLIRRRSRGRAKHAAPQFLD